jgi:acyl-CoA thioester hydrolase
MDIVSWYQHGVTVQPHHTDYAGIVWHGTYIAWMEEARVAYLRSYGLTFADWLKAGVDLPVVDLSLRYRQSLSLGDEALIRVGLEPFKGARMIWHYEISNGATQALCVSGRVKLATVDLETRRVLRELPEPLQVVQDWWMGR